MKKVSPLLITFVLLLTACGGPMTLTYGSSTLTYDSGTWEEFENDSANGLGVKGSDGCWAVLEGTLTTPLPSEMDTLLSGTLDSLTAYTYPGDAQPSYVALPLENDTLFIRVGYDQEAAACLEAIQELATMN